MGEMFLRTLVRKEPVSWVYRRPWLRKKTYLLRNHKELRSRREET